MRRIACIAAVLTTATLCFAGGEPLTRVYELRIDTVADGRLNALHERLRDHAPKLYQRHGIQPVAVFSPAEGSPNRLYCLFAYASKEARDASWRVCHADPEYQRMFGDAGKEGKMIVKSESLILQPTDYCPEVKVEAKGDRVFELRTYTTPAGLLPNLHARFRDHTLKLFEKHGMTNIAYWTPTKEQKDADVTLVYLLAHKSVDAAKASFKTFKDDPAWTAARADSERKAGGSLTARDGVKSAFLKPTDYSPLR